MWFNERWNVYSLWLASRWLVFHHKLIITCCKNGSQVFTFNWPAQLAFLCAIKKVRNPIRKELHFPPPSSWQWNAFANQLIVILYKSQCAKWAAALSSSTIECFVCRCCAKQRRHKRTPDYSNSVFLNSFANSVDLSRIPPGSISFPEAANPWQRQPVNFGASSIRVPISAGS